MEREILKKIKKITEEFFDKAGIDAEVGVKDAEGSTAAVSLKAEDPEILIGQGGETLSEIQHVLRLILRRKLGLEQNLYVDLDINDYKKKKADYLRETAMAAADEVSLLKKEKILPPMSSYERRIVHMELSGRTDVVTESRGEEPERYVVILPKA